MMQKNSISPGLSKALHYRCRRTDQGSGDYESKVKRVSECLVLVLLCLTFLRNGVFATDLTLWTDILKKSPDKQRAHFNYGCVLSRNELYEQALQEFGLSLNSPESYGFSKKDVYIEIGKADFFLKRFDEAAGAWQHALRFGSKDPEVLNNLAMAMLKLERIKEALSLAESARENASENLMPEVLLTLAQIYASQKDFSKTEKLIEVSLQQSAGAPQILFSVAVLYEEVGMYEQAGYYARKYLASRDTVFATRAVSLLNRASLSGSARDDSAR